MTQAPTNGRRGETLDESIDRIAASLTDVPPDPGFAARTEAVLDARPSRSPLWIAASAAAAILVAAVVFTVTLGERDTRVVDAVPTGAIEAPWPAAERLKGARDSTPALQRSTLQRAAAPREARSGRLSRGHEPETVEPSVQPIAALTSPRTLNVDVLTFESLTIAPVELAHLNLANLDIPELDATSERKEQ